MAEQAKAAGSGTYLGALWGMGESMVAYASSALGYEDFKVIDPNAKEAKRGDAAVDEGVHGEVGSTRACDGAVQLARAPPPSHAC